MRRRDRTAWRVLQHLGRSEGGFTLLEVMVTVGIVLTAVTVMAFTAMSALSHIGLARQRQGANGLANQAMEQVRALPFSAVQAGMDNADLQANVAADPNIVACGTEYCYAPTGEQIARGNIDADGVSTCQEPGLPHPLVPYSCTFTVGATDYTVSVYVTRYQPPNQPLDPESNTFRVTVHVGWPNPQVRGVSSGVTTQSLFYSPSGGCISSSTHPFAAPCQPFLYATADVQPGTVELSGVVSGIADDAANPVAAAVSLPEYSSNSQIEQISLVQGIAQTSGVSLTLPGQDSQTLGLPLRDTSVADNDPSQPGQEYDRSSPYPLVGPSSGQLTATGTPNANGNSNRVIVTSSGGDTYGTTSTTAANATNVCTNKEGSGQTDAQPCGNSTAVQGDDMSVNLDLWTGSRNLAPTTLVSIDDPSRAGVAFTNRDVAPQGTCPATSGDGCVHASALRQVGAVTFADIPPNWPGGLPSGWQGFLVQLTGFEDSVAAEAGVGAGPNGASVAGTITYLAAFDPLLGATYASLPVSTGPAVDLPVSQLTLARSFEDGSTLVLQVIPQLRTGEASAPAPEPVNCSPVPCPGDIASAEATSTSPISGTIRYVVTLDAQTLADLTIDVNLGTLQARADYEPTTGSGT